MTKPNELRPQIINDKTVPRSTLILAISLTFFATAGLVTIANWFMFSNIHASARADVYSDIQAAAKQSK